MLTPKSRNENIPQEMKKGFPSKPIVSVSGQTVRKSDLKKLLGIFADMVAGDGLYRLEITITEVQKE